MQKVEQIIVNVFIKRFKRFFKFFPTFYVFNVFLNFFLERFLTSMVTMGQGLLRYSRHIIRCLAIRQ